MYEDLKAGIIDVLSRIKDIDIFFEMNEDTLKTPEYFFVMIKPVINESLSKGAHKKVYLVDIRYYSEDWNHLKYMVMGEKLDEAIRPVLKFGDFNASINDTDINVVDEELHVRFKVGVIYKLKEESTAKLMRELETVVSERK